MLFAGASTRRIGSIVGLRNHRVADSLRHSPCSTSTLSVPPHHVTTTSLLCFSTLDNVQRHSSFPCGSATSQARSRCMRRWAFRFVRLAYFPRRGWALAQLRSDSISDTTGFCPGSWAGLALLRVPTTHGACSAAEWRPSCPGSSCC